MEGNFIDKVKEIINNTPDTTGEFDEKDIQDNKVMALLSYVSWLVLVPIFAAKDSKFARYHANQGIVLAIAEIIVWVALGILSGIPFIGWLFSIIMWLFNIAVFAYAVLGVINVLNGKAKELPYVGKYRILK